MKKAILIWVFLFGCTNTNEQFFKNSLNDYLVNHPVNLLYQIDNFGERTLINCVHPYYKVEFLKNSLGEKSLKIIQEMYYIENQHENEKKPMGIFYYKDLPIIVYDDFGFGKDFLFTSIDSIIPDSLKYDFVKCNGQLLHNSKNKAKTYLIK
ncbi:MAG: hypothetical protein GX163_00010 [Bacteroidetes bacterium]|nr:hypothetical protein [Bacteroidota bacterium]